MNQLLRREREQSTSRKRDATAAEILSSSLVSNSPFKKKRSIKWMRAKYCDHNCCTNVIACNHLKKEMRCVNQTHGCRSHSLCDGDHEVRWETFRPKVPLDELYHKEVVAFGNAEARIRFLGRCANFELDPNKNLACHTVSQLVSLCNHKDVLNQRLKTKNKKDVILTCMNVGGTNHYTTQFEKKGEVELKRTSTSQMMSLLGEASAEQVESYMGLSIREYHALTGSLPTITPQKMTHKFKQCRINKGAFWPQWDRFVFLKLGKGKKWGGIWDDDIYEEPPQNKKGKDKTKKKHTKEGELVKDKEDGSDNDDDDDDEEEEGEGGGGNGEEPTDESEEDSEEDDEGKQEDNE